MAYRISYSKAVRRQIKSLRGHVKAMAKQEIAGPSDNRGRPGARS
jgi:mRNA-degrading endonuclease RelE of RelBE toxin-antitoxin system